MSSTHDPQQPCHIDRLPVELITKILHHLEALIKQLDSWDIQPHRKTFVRIMCVSKRFKMIATPFVNRCIVVWPSTELSTLRRVGRDGTSGPAQACRVLRLHDAEESAEAVLRVDEWATRLPWVEEVTLEEFWSPGCLSEAAAFSNLRRLDLHLCAFDLWPTTSTATFSRLITLKLSWVSFDHTSGVNDRTARALFPKLRQLEVKASSFRDLPRRPLLPLEFVQQLDALRVETDDRDLRIGGIIRIDDLDLGHAVLWHYPLCASDPCVTRSVAYLLIELWPDCDIVFESQSTDERNRLFMDLANVVANLPHLRLLLVPPILWHHVERTSAAISQRQSSIKSECERRGIVVRTYDAARPLDGLVVPEFLEWRREQAQEQAQTASGTVQG
ncbi:hypothetical protein JCM8208_004410 [Rhodotorula glutinis]